MQIVMLMLDFSIIRVSTTNVRRISHQVHPVTHLMSVVSMVMLISYLQKAILFVLHAKDQ